MLLKAQCALRGSGHFAAKKCSSAWPGIRSRNSVYSIAGLRVDDIVRAGAVVADMRKIIRQDPRIIQKLHRRVFLDKITREQVSIYISCYVEAPNRDAFMAVKQDLLLAFTDCVERNGARLARNRLQVSTAACHVLAMYLIYNIVHICVLQVGLHSCCQGGFVASQSTAVAQLLASLILL